MAVSSCTMLRCNSSDIQIEKVKRSAASDVIRTSWIVGGDDMNGVEWSGVGRHVI